MAGIVFDVHGLIVSVSSCDKKFLEYCTEFLRYFYTEISINNRKKDIDIFVSMNKREDWFQQEGNLKIGEQIYLDEEYLEIPVPYLNDIQCRFLKLKGECTENIKCAYVAPGWRKLAGKLKSPKSYVTQVYMTLIRQAIVIPVLARLADKNGWVTLHGAVVAKGSSAVIFTGLNGCGKSGLAWYLVKNHGFTLLSDNFALMDPSTNQAYCFPEVLRLGKEEAGSFSLRRENITDAYGKEQYRINDKYIKEKANIKAVLLLRVGKTAAINKVDHQNFSHNVEVLHRYLAETPDYSWLNFAYHLFGMTDLAKVNSHARKDIFEQVLTYEISIEKNKSLPERYEPIAVWISNLLAKSNS